MKKFIVFIFALALIASPRFVFAADKGLHLGNIDKDSKKTKIEAKKADQEAEKTKKQAEKDAEKEKKKAEKELEKAKKKTEKEAKQAKNKAEREAKKKNKLIE